MALLFTDETEIEILAQTSCKKELGIILDQQSLETDVLILDIQVENELKNSTKWILEILAKYSHLKIILLIRHAVGFHTFEIIQTGIYGLLLTDCAAKELKEAIKRVGLGKLYYQAEILDNLERFLGNRQLNSDDQIFLTSIERKILINTINGMDYVDLQLKLRLSVKALTQHWHNIQLKFGTSDQWEIIRLSAQMGILYQS